MNKEDILRNVYNDFFGNKEYVTNNKNDLKDAETPEIIVKPIQKENVEEVYNNLIEKIDKLYIDEKSKDTLKNIIEYMRKYFEKIESKYIPFNLTVYSNNTETIKEIISIIENASKVFKYTKSGKTTNLSLFNLTNSEELEKIYSNSSIIFFADFEGLQSKEQNIKDKFNFDFSNVLTKYENSTITILTTKNKDMVKGLFENNVTISNRIFDFEIVGINPDVQEAYNEILEKLDENNLDDNLKIELLDYISTTFPKTDMSYPEYRDDLINKIIFNKKVPEYTQNKTIEEVFEELDGLVGLDKVKKMLRELVDLITLKDKSKDFLKIKNVNLHMVFLGNPGTGKTTVARIISKILYELNYIKKDKLVEVTSKDLVAEYVGQTAIKTANVVSKAMGGVLFIDEAYSLASGNGQGNSYNEEAVATLIQLMENNRDDLVVIFAGYTKEMQDFLNLNSGIVSRIGYTVEFEDYTTEELIKIFNQMMEKSGFVVSKEAIKKLEDIINANRNMKNFGNARFVRNIYEKSIIKHASNTKNKIAKNVLKTITEEDISTENM